MITERIPYLNKSVPIINPISDKYMQLIKIGSESITGRIENKILVAMIDIDFELEKRYTINATTP